MLHSVEKDTLVTTKAHQVDSYPFGLFSVASVSNYAEADDHWARYTAHSYDSAAFRSTLLTTNDATSYTLYDGIGLPRFLEYIPFGIEVEDFSSTFSVLSQDRRARVINILDDITQKSVEREFWSGDTAKYGTGAIGGAYTAGTVAATYASSVITLTITGGTSRLKDGDLVNVTGLTYTGATGPTAGPFTVSGSTVVGGATIKYAAPTGTSGVSGTPVVTAPNLNNYLTKAGSSTNLTVTPAGDNMRLALANIEKNLAACPLGARGTIHMTRKAASMLSAYGLIERVDFSARLDKQDVNEKKQALVTILGTPVVVGSGYSGDGPTNATGAAVTASAEWIFGTGYVDVHLGASSVINEDMARSVVPATNDVHIRAARTAAVHFEPCCHYAVRIDFSTINSYQETAHHGNSRLRRIRPRCCHSRHSLKCGWFATEWRFGQLHNVRIHPHVLHTRV